MSEWDGARERVLGREFQSGPGPRNDAMKKTVPRMKTRLAPVKPAVVWIRSAHTLLGPEARAAQSRELTASDASTDTVIAVPNAMANVPRIPAHNMPWLRAK